MTGSEKKLGPGTVVGIVGGGQLGRMLAQAASSLGMACHIYCNDADTPALDVARSHTVAAYDDEAALADFARAVDVATFEFENIPARTLQLIAAHTLARPSERALAVAQDRLFEKRLFKELDLSTAPYRQVNSLGDLTAAIGEVGCPGLLKTRTLGYDGKGQVRIEEGEGAGAALASIGQVPAIYERIVPFDCELSVISVRSSDGNIVQYDPSENLHSEQMLRLSQVPAHVPVEIMETAKVMARDIVEALEVVGVLAVEFFHIEGAERPLLVNEIAPRVHNSGHWTMDACAVGQFENHIRAICGWPLADPARHSDAVMTNLVGDDLAHWEMLAAHPMAALHIYGKAQARAGRKMGHITQLAPRDSQD